MFFSCLFFIFRGDTKLLWLDIPLFLPLGRETTRFLDGAVKLPRVKFKIQGKENKMPGFNDTGDTNQAAAGQETTVPVEVVEKLRDELRQSKEESGLLKDQVELYKANMTTTSPVTEPSPDIKDDDVITFAEAKKLIADASRNIAGSLQQLEIGQANIDFNEVITKYLPALLKENPALTGAIRSSSNPALLAYNLAKGSTAHQTDVAKNKLTGNEAKIKDLEAKVAKGDTEAQKLLDKIQKPGSASQVGGAGGGVSSSEFYANMSDQDFEARIAEVQARS